MNYLSVCDGIGAFHLASQPLDWKCVAVSEIGPFPNAVVEHMYHFRNLGDMTKYRDWPEWLLADVDLLVGGTPCTSYSSAGKRKGLNDDQGRLVMDFAELFDHINTTRKKHGRPPAIALFENVPPLLQSKDNAFGHFVGRLLRCPEAPRTQSGTWHTAGLLCSDTVRVGWRVLDAQFFAVAQRRPRVFVVAVPCELVEGRGERTCPSQILSLPKSMLGCTPKREPSQQEAAGSGAGGAARRIAGEDAGATDCGPQEVVAFNYNARGCELPPESRDIRIADTLTASQRVAVVFAVDGRNQAAEEEVHHTLRTGRDSSDAIVIGSRAVSGKHRAQASDGLHSSGTPVEALAPLVFTARKLMPLESERLQGLPDNYTLVPYRGKLASDSQRFRAIGNSIAVPVLHWICRRISEAFAGGLPYD